MAAIVRASRTLLAQSPSSASSTSFFNSCRRRTLLSSSSLSFVKPFQIRSMADSAFKKVPIQRDDTVSFSISRSILQLWMFLLMGSDFLTDTWTGFLLIYTFLTWNSFCLFVFIVNSLLFQKRWSLLYVFVDNCGRGRNCMTLTILVPKSGELDINKTFCHWSFAGISFTMMH